MSNFNTFNLDRRIFKAIAKKGYTHTTNVQNKCIPSSLDGQDIICQAITGSGKTLSYILPLLQLLLQYKTQDENDIIGVMRSLPDGVALSQVAQKFEEKGYGDLRTKVGDLDKGTVSQIGQILSEKPPFRNA